MSRCRFDINFIEGHDSDYSDIAFHTSCRLKQKEYVFNTKHSGQWGKEEKYKINLQKSYPFLIRIRCHGDHFEVS